MGSSRPGPAPTLELVIVSDDDRVRADLFALGGPTGLTLVALASGPACLEHLERRADRVAAALLAFDEGDGVGPPLVWTIQSNWPWIRVVSLCPAVLLDRLPIETWRVPSPGLPLDLVTALLTVLDEPTPAGARGRSGQSGPASAA